MTHKVELLVWHHGAYLCALQLLRICRNRVYSQEFSLLSHGVNILILLHTHLLNVMSCHND